MTDDEVRAAVAAVPWWYHRIELRPGIVTPGWAPLVPEAYKIPADLTGKRVLDVGAWDGYWTWEALRRGAAFVTAIDDHSDACGYLTDEQRSKPWATWDLCREALGYSNCERLNLSIYDVEAYLETFDVIFFFGVLYHLKHPMFAFERLYEVLKPGGTIHVETAVLDHYYSRYVDGKIYGENECCAEFFPGSEYGGNATNWWVPTMRCAGGMMQASGFRDIQCWYLTKEPKHVSEARGFLRATK